MMTTLWADDAEEDLGWSVVCSHKTSNQKKPVVFGKGIDRYESFHLKHRSPLRLSFVDGTEIHPFHSVYHFVQCQKVSMFGTQEQLKAIMTIPLSVDAERKMKELGQNLEKFDKAKWREMELTVVMHAYTAKLHQNKLFEQELASTNDREIILEGVPWWGTMSFSSSDESQNMLGKLLQSLRQKTYYE